MRPWRVTIESKEENVVHTYKELSFYKLIDLGLGLVFDMSLTGSDAKLKHAVIKSTGS